RGRVRGLGQRCLLVWRWCQLLRFDRPSGRQTGGRWTAARPYCGRAHGTRPSRAAVTPGRPLVSLAGDAATGGGCGSSDLASDEVRQLVPDQLCPAVIQGPSDRVSATEGPLAPTNPLS